MPRIEFKKKPRKDPFHDTWTDGHGIYIGKDWALQNEIDETKKSTQGRSCFRACGTCGACANSRRDNFMLQVKVYKDGEWITKTPTMSFDHNAGRWIDCKKCEPFRFHDCHNGVFRDTHQDPEPFTPDVIELMRKSGGKPLI